MRIPILIVTLAFVISSVYVACLGPPSADPGDDPDQFHPIVTEEQTWSEPQRITENPAPSEMPQLMHDRYDNIHLVWSNQVRGEYQLFYTKLDSCGNTLIAAKQLTNSHARSFQPSVAVDTADRVHIVWLEKSVDHWTFFYKQLGLDGDEHIHAIAVADLQPKDFVSSPALPPLTDGITRDRHTVGYLHDESAAKATIRADADGNIHIFWTDLRNRNYEIYYSKLDPNGFVLVDEKRLTHTEMDSYNPAVVQDESGMFHLFWGDNGREGTELHYMKLDACGAIVRSDQTLAVVEDPYMLDPATAIDCTGVIHVVWGDGRTNALDTDYQIHYLQLATSGTVISADTPITSALVEAYHPVIKVDDDDTLHLVWQDGRIAANTELYYLTLTPTGAIDQPTTRLTYGSLGSEWPALDIDGRGRIHVCWVDERDGNAEVYYKHSETARTTTYPETGYGFESSVEDDRLVTLATTTASLSMIGLVGWYVGTPSGRTSFLFFVLPLYSRIKRNKLLEHDLRSDLYDFICDQPGESFSALMAEFDLKNGVLAYHLRRLEQEELIKSKKDGVYRRYYPYEMKDVPLTLESRIIITLMEHPGISQSTIAQMLDMSRQVINYHVNNLQDEGRLQVTRDGRQSYCYVNPKHYPLLAELN